MNMVCSKIIKKNFQSKTCFLKNALILYSIIIFVFIAFAAKVNRYGDGFEYIYMSESFIQHKTPELLENDVRISQEKLKTQNPRQFDSFLDSHLGFFKANNGRYYSYHFWLYSLIVSPIQQAIKLINGNELRAFGITNVLLYIATLWITYLFSPKEKRFLLTGIIAASPLVPYVIWTHPEVFSASLVTMAIVFYLRENFQLALLLSALASCQNPPISVFVIWCGLVYLLRIWKKYRNEGVFNIRDFLITGLCASPILLSPLFYLINFSTPNLIAKTGYADFRLISFHRLFSYFFDLNQGAILYSGLLLLIFIYCVIKNVAYKNFAYLELAFCTVLMAILSLPAPNWNCGITCVIRYFVWTYPFMAFYVAYSINPKRSKLWSYLLVANMVVICFLQSGFHGRDDYLNFNFISRKILSNYPYLYNPEHAIFMKRALNRPAYAQTTMFVNKNNEIKKILTNRDGWVEIKNGREDCIAKDLDFYERELAKFKGSHLRYVNITKNQVVKLLPLLKINRKLMFNEIDKAIPGLSNKEPWGRWSDAALVKFRIKFLSLNKNANSIILKISGSPYLSNHHRNLKMKAYINDKYASSWSFSVDESIPKELYLPISIPDVLNDSPICELKFEIDNPISPAEIGDSTDTRKLGFGFVSLEVLDSAEAK